MLLPTTEHESRARFLKAVFELFFDDGKVHIKRIFS
jgi:hypothetical protein